ncbi:macro domain-containing protein [Gloeocapsa sp. PCC 73106]|uniref:macro domain-containing protein n=1 Tax=Gloeocapsa sp. PCC 73106 TaxID=102232 RepID=UPI0002ABFE07|nr:macro domain-containing protein [Gloeocapsa sp. PCC 73106]ELR97587.1 putative phosphatase, C-terminal domain of histone macro H2A1 like protein [Gloeocapsa sp. PCC 73106]
MLEYRQTTVFNLNAQTIVNTVNCVGVMGAGLALEFKLRFPQMYAEYVSQCRKKGITVGKVNFYRNDDEPHIINFPTKNHWKYPSQLEWIETGLQDFAAKYQEWGITSIAFPRLGCDRGGLNWSQVKLLMEKYLSNLPQLTVYICLDNETTAQGVEKQMLDLLTQTELWVEKFPLSYPVMEKITKSLPLRRFRDFKNISGIGQDTYQEMFKFLYNLTQTAQPGTVIDEGIFQITDLRIRLVMLFKYLGFNAEEISQLEVRNLLQQGKELLILAPNQQNVVISGKVWQKMGVNLTELSPEEPLILNKQKRGKHLKSGTIKTLITTGNKLLQQKDIQQLSLFSL